MPIKPRNDGSGKMATGRPTKYDPKYCDEIVEYFEQARAEVLVDVSFYNTNKDTDISQIINPIYENKEESDLLNTGPVRKIEQKVVMNRFPSYVRFARMIGVNKSTLFERALEHTDFSNSMKVCNDIAETILLENGLQGIYNAGFTQFLLKNNYGYKDKTDIESKIDMKVNDISDKQKSAIESLKGMFMK